MTITHMAPHPLHGLLSRRFMLQSLGSVLVEQIGFAGILKIPCLSRLNLRFSKWVMSKIDPNERCINIGSNRSIRFWAADVHKVLGIPCGNCDIQAPDAQCSSPTIMFIKSTLGMSKGKSILKAAEEILARPLSEGSSSNLEKDCFKMAFVIFVVGHLLAPSTKHDHTIIDFRGAISNTNNITDFNWCEYVLQDLFKGVAKLKLDIQNSREITHLHGCHLFAQVTHYPLLSIFHTCFQQPPKTTHNAILKC
jgi:hypothetical protein